MKVNLVIQYVAAVVFSNMSLVIFVIFWTTQSKPNLDMLLILSILEADKEHIALHLEFFTHIYTYISSSSLFVWQGLVVKVPESLIIGLLLQLWPRWCVASFRRASFFYFSSSCLFSCKVITTEKTESGDSTLVG